MRLQRHDTAREFLHSAGPFLLRAEAENNLILGLVGDMAAGTRVWDAMYLATVEEDGQVVACAMRTPPHKPVLTSAPEEAIELLAADFQERYGELNGVLAPHDTSRAFAETWAARVGTTFRQGMRQRIYRLERVLDPPVPAPGRFRPATEGDLERLVPWEEGFLADTGAAHIRDVPERARRRIERGTIYLWEDDEPVSMAAWAGRTENGVRIGLVYTPPELRGRGYATACVAELSRKLLREGRRFCFLYTDLSNPTSNRIYRRIGYEPVCDATDFLFGEHEGRGEGGASPRAPDPPTS
jgi:predicted GNAT family acetyltransferase